MTEPDRGRPMKTQKEVVYNDMNEKRFKLFARKFNENIAKITA